MGHENGNRKRNRKGIEKGIEKGREEGREKGLQAGSFIGRILLCQKLLGRPETPSAELQIRSLQDLQELASQLEADLRNR